MRFILEKEGKRFEYAVPEGNMIVGRDRKSDISIQDTNVSRHHMTIVRRIDDILIRDLGSRNGTFVNNERITESKLNPGDIVRLGNLSLFFDDGTPGLEIPEGLGAMNEQAASAGGDGVPTPPGGMAADPAVAPADPYADKTAEPGPVGAPSSVLEEPGDDDSLMGKARYFYLTHKVQVIAGLGVLVALLIVFSVVKNVVFTKKKPRKRTMPLSMYDEFLDEGVNHFDKWIASRSRKDDLSAAKVRFRKIKKYHPTRQTANIMLDIVDTWEAADGNYENFAWEKAKRLLGEIANHPNATPTARNFGQARIQWWRNERVTRTIQAAGDQAYADQNWQKALDEYSKLTRYKESRPYQLRHDRIPIIRKKLYDRYYDLGMNQKNGDNWQSAIEMFEKAKDYSDEKQISLLNTLIGNCKKAIEESKVFDEILDLEGQGRLDEALAKLDQIPEESKNIRQAERIRKRLITKTTLRDGKKLFEAGQAEAAIKKLSDPLVSSDVEAVNIRDKARKILAAFEKGDRILKETMAKIRDLEKPTPLSGFDSAKDAFEEVKRFVGESENIYYKQAEERLDDLTPARIGKLYFEKAEALLSTKKLKLARDFIDLARRYDLSLGKSIIAGWVQQAGKKYNLARNLVTSDKPKARALCQWIIDTLRSGDSDYLEKSLDLMGKLAD